MKNYLIGAKLSSFFEKLHKQTEYLMNSFNKSASTYSMHFHTDFEGGMFGLFFHDSHKIRNYEEIKKDVLKN